MVGAYLSLNAVSIEYPKRKAVVRDLNLSLPLGELTVLIGANGAGKSSLLRVAAGLQKPQSGVVCWNGKLLKEIALSQRARQLGALLRSQGAPPDMRLGEFIALGRIPHTGVFGKLTAADHRVAEQAAVRVGIANLYYESVHHLSDGELRKGQLAQLLAQDVPFLILDEPTTHLDPPSGHQFMNLLKELTLAGKGVLLTTHDLALAHQFADQMLLLHQGHLLRGSSEFILQQSLYTDFMGPGEKNM